MSRIPLLFIFLIPVVFETNAQLPKLVLPIGHTNTITTANFSPDGRHIISSSNDKTIKLWDANTGMVLADLGSTSHFKPEYSPGGDRILTLNADENAIHLWNGKTGELVGKFESAEIDDAHFSPNGKQWAFVSGDSIRVFDTYSGELITTLHDEYVPVSSFRFSPSGDKIISSDHRLTTSIWDIKEAYVSGQLFADLMDDVAAFHVLPGSLGVITIHRDNQIRLWDPEAEELVRTISFSDFEAIDLFETSPVGSLAVVSVIPKGDHGLFKPHEIIVVDLKTGKRIYQLSSNHRKHINDIRAISFAPGGKEFVTSSYDGTAVTWNAATGQKLRSFGAGGAAIYLAAYSPDESKLLASTSQTIIIWDKNNGRIKASLEDHSYRHDKTQFSPDGKFILTTPAFGNVLFWNTETAMPNREILSKDNYYTQATFSPDMKRVAYCSGTGDTLVIRDYPGGGNAVMVRGNYGLIKFSPDNKKLFMNRFYRPECLVVEASTGKTLFELTGHTENLKSILFSPDGTQVMTLSNDASVSIWNTSNGKLINTIPSKSGIRNALWIPGSSRLLLATYEKFWMADAGTGQPLMEFGPVDEGEEDELENYFHIELMAVSPDGKKVTVVRHRKARVWDVPSGNYLFTIRHKESIRSVTFSADGKKILTSSWDKSAGVWDADNGNEFSIFNTHDNLVLDAQFSPDGQKVLTRAFDNTLRVWDVPQKKLLYTFLTVDSTDYFIQSPGHFYIATRPAAKLLHYVTNQLGVITFEQLDVRFNQPHRVLQSIGCQDTSLIKSYRKAWEKRIRKLGMDTTAFKETLHIPEADIINRDSIRFEQQDRKLVLHIIGKDSLYGLNRFNVWVNESPLFGQRGIHFNGQDKKKWDFDTTITIYLTSGINRIETSVLNNVGTESYRIPLIVSHIPQIKAKEKVYFIGIGIDRFADENYNLKYSTKDIRDLCSKLKVRYRDAITIDTLFNENVTLSRIASLKEKLKSTTVDDKVILSYSGHGLLSDEFDYFLSTYDIDFNQPGGKGLPYDELENLFDNIPARKKLMLIDACHSGEVDKEDVVRLEMATDSLVKGLKPVALRKDGQLGLNNSFELMQNLFVNVSKHTGATVISAAGGTQFALESNDLKNGVFTFSILELLNKKPKIKVSELRKQVGIRVEQLTNGRQKPTSRNENILVDWEF